MMKLIKILILFTILSIFGCTENPAPPIQKFQKKEIVKTVVGDNIGQIISANCYGYHDGCRYYVRFSYGSQYTNTHILSNDEAIKFSPMSDLMFMREFELKKYND